MEKDKGLKLEVRLLTDTIYQNHPLLVEAVLTNIGHQPIMVNKRLAIGYKNSVSRELYVEITGEKNQALYHPLDINRDLPSKVDYQLLAPQDSVSTTFDLFEYYRLLNGGGYVLIFYYEATEPLAKTPNNVFKGKVESTPISIKILPGILKDN